MSEDQLNKIIEKCFDFGKFNKLTAIQLLLLRVIEHYNQESIDYTAEFKLQTHNIKKEYNKLDKHIKNVAGLISIYASNTLENKLNLMNDFEKFVSLTDEFIKGSE